ncbi:MAG TPA: ubiquitin-like protein Pup [Acidimicrobiia bacterium]|nr:ubiquitin-like protein Pup [Acidimicrobiia bacterium]
MTDREQAKRRTGDEAEDIDEAIEITESEATDIDDLLDEIDTVLEENAEEFVKNYVQKGGQ